MGRGLLVFVVGAWLKLTVEFHKHARRARKLTGWHTFALVALVFTIALSVQCHQAGHAASVAAPPHMVEFVPTAAIVSDVVDRNEQLARTDPLGFLQLCLDHHNADVRDYRCTFTKRESISGEVLPAQVVDVRHRQEPFSVDMTFVKNVRECKRALYVAGEWLDDDGNELAWAKPGGAILRTFLPRVKQPIHGRRAEKASRRGIDQFGFRRSLELILQYSRKAEAEGKLSFEYTGHGTIGGRPTYVFRRLLPYTGDERDYPDRLLILHVDQEHMVPTACYCFADDLGQDMLGTYVYTDLRLNPGYTAADFDPNEISF